MSALINKHAAHNVNARWQVEAAKLDAAELEAAIAANLTGLGYGG